MQTIKFIVEVKVPKKLGICEIGEDGIFDPKKYDEVQDRKYCDELKYNVIKHYENHLEDFKERAEDDIFEGIEDCLIENWEEMSDYKIQVNITKE